ncbi:receptor-like protein kinase FERONIA [Neltuma alba]|uniref:receptor-like protein kinase FERONIA n=1 Tax=Neltuma alba TaxID=207710 RepID=UPI0010A2AA4F|nr:receptor-like protein kinase FERONIA [Prosopis alba]
MPDYLYYTKADSPGFNLIGAQVMFYIPTNVALQTKYRLNVGGCEISDTDDTGMLRSWDFDDSFLVSHCQLPADFEGERRPLIFTKVPNYTVPERVYRTERNMGMNKTLNKSTNLTWEFPVDSGFTYMLRLHFCELTPGINDSYNRMFDIYIADQLAEEGANVLKWAKGKAVPVYKDYAVIVPGDAKPANLSLKMHPVSGSMTEYSDAFLNGLEIFKISDRNLAGPNSYLPPPPPPNSNELPRENQRRRRSKIIGVVVCTAAFVAVLVLIVAFCLITRGMNVKSSDYGIFKRFQLFTTKSVNIITSGSIVRTELCHHSPIVEIRAATNNFDELFLIGVGGFGNVYKGYINDGQTPVAIKRLKQGSQQGLHEFRTEIEMLSQLRHNHLVSLIGYCNDGNEMILVYEFMARGTLRDHLYNSNNHPLSWKQRLKICQGAAQGLHYLHTGAIRNIIHRDVKTTNILLDEKWVAKFSDFGLSKIGPTGMSKSHISTVVKGSIGYLDPEYYKRQRLTLKSDVYSFGVVLLEVLCGRPPFLRTVEKEKASLVEWVSKCHREGVICETVDSFITESIRPESLKAFSDMALKCLEDDPNERPSMSEVEWGLEFALQLQESAEETGDEGKREEERALLTEVTDVEERHEVGFDNVEISFALWNDVKSQV